MADAQANDKPVLTLNDKNYVIEDLSEQARYCVAQIQDLESQIGQSKARLDQLEVAKRGFTDLLTTEVEKPDEPEAPAEAETVQ
jgi:hypothetical protein